ncbi:aminodeoxychorismate synthase component I [Acinetobacter sp. S40]|uniref:aminodeoxychorismate synthase component I n=1 Tax=unclassified Acinetobacter TaxID=196816 RepID=UPI00190A94D2|nr:MULTISPECIES: aminodeoxychorismate synthase component I [unclassified Acinetobacter]MBJ9985926.1 aminodeoxychorismate synthase component I [Acinetobacter sp. S40]MBK0064429.1 aminodeoxychorismate synthase component I [Acinetobacter sp. S55]MBK0067127.1 aminodeoxychorismate synthase component I [Acinetobacter sp. S54]
MKFFCKINQDISSTSEILSKLHTMSGLVFLKDQNYPVIAFNPNHYLIYKNNQFSFFKINSEKQYEMMDEFAIDSLLQFDSSQNHPVFTQFQGGYIGFVSYDYAAKQFTSVRERPQPAFYLGRYESFLKQQEDGWYFYSHADDAEQQFIQLRTLLSQPITIEELELTQACHPRWSKSEYANAFQQIQNYIVAGDCYQINLTQEFTAKGQGSLLSRAESLWNLTDAPYAGYLKLDDFELLSCSPELFIEFKQQQLITRPIKGTMPRFADPDLDAASKQKLQNSEKDQAENVMIVDLLRNDLSIHAETGSVKTTKLFEIESFNQVHHMVSEIEAQLKSEVNPFDVLMSALPGGSITGAPKIRAMQIIEELEGGSRGAYCGSLGYFNFDGSGRWNILIRSIQKFQDELSIWAGGGITIASDCEAEYQECFDKISAMLNLLNTWQIKN